MSVLTYDSPCPELLRTKDTIHRPGCIALKAATRWKPVVWKYAQGKTVGDVLEHGFDMGLHRCQRCCPLAWTERS